MNLYKSIAQSGLSVFLVVQLVVTQQMPVYGEQTNPPNHMPGPAENEVPPNNVPPPTDNSPKTLYQFSASSGGDIGLYLSRSDRPGKLKFNIPISGAFGLASSSIEQLIQNGVLPAQSTLTIAAWDVDSQPSACPEVDEVFINGNKVGTLVGGNNIWTDWTLQFPTQYLKLPRVSDADAYVNGIPKPAVEQQLIEININALGCSNNVDWRVQVGWGAIAFSKVAFRPMVLVHGWNSNNRMWETFIRQNLDPKGIPYHRIDLPNNGTAPLPESRDFLVQEIQKTLKAYGVSEVDLVAHSKGGLVSRMAIDALPAGTVRNLITLATPHHGVSEYYLQPVKDNGLRPAVEYLCGLTFTTDQDKARCLQAGAELTLSRIRDSLNYSGCNNPVLGYVCVLKASPRAGTRYASFAAQLSNPPDLILFINDDKDSDGLVTLRSATYPWKANAKPYPTQPNVDLVRSGQHHASIYNLQDIHACVLAYLGYPNNTCSSPPTLPLAQTNAAEPLLPEETDQVTSTMQLVNAQDINAPTAGTYTFTVSMDGSGDSDMRLYSSQPVSLSLLSPSGVLITPNSVNANIGYAAWQGMLFAPEGNTYQYQLRAPQAGQWRAVINSTQPFFAALSTYTRSSVVLVAKPSAVNIIAGQAITLEAQLTGIATTPVLTGWVYITSSLSPTLLAFQDTGTNGDAVANDNRFTANWVAPSNSSGYVPFSVLARSGLTTRVASFEILINPQSAEISGTWQYQTPDANANGLYDSLTFQVPVSVRKAGKFMVEGTLVNAQGTVIDRMSYSTPNPLNVGQATLPLVFDAKAIRLANANGPYRLAYVDLSDITQVIVPLQQLKDVAPTSALSVTQFESPPLEIDKQKITDSLLDTNNDNKADVLRISIPISYTNPGTYFWSGILQTLDGKHIARIRSEGTLANNTLNLDVGGTSLLALSSDARYHLSNLLMAQKTGPGFGDYGSQLFTDLFTTRLITRSQMGTTVTQYYTVQLDGEPLVITRTMSGQYFIVSFAEGSLNKNLFIPSLRQSLASTPPISPTAPITDIYGANAPNLVVAIESSWGIDSGIELYCPSWSNTQVSSEPIYTGLFIYKPAQAGNCTIRFPDNSTDGSQATYKVMLSRRYAKPVPIQNNIPVVINQQRYGQVAFLTFSAQAGQQFTLKVSGPSANYRWYLLNPDGSGTYDENQRDWQVNLPPLRYTGVYSIGLRPLVNPSSWETGLYTVTLSPK